MKSVCFNMKVILNILLVCTKVLLKMLYSNDKERIITYTLWAMIMDKGGDLGE